MGFTLAEVLAALAFLAIVIPVAVGGLQVASRAGQAAQRRAAAARVAERVLNEYMVAPSQVGGMTRGVVEEDSQTYTWSLRSEPWPEGSMRLITAEVAYSIQGEDYLFRLSTLTSIGSP
jgi:type II secretory pathway pseudopilin PulG